MYSSFLNQLYHWGHYAFAFWLLLILLPKMIFAPVYPDRVEQRFSNAILMVAFYIILAHVLVVTKLFEVLAILGVLALIILRSYILPRAKEKRTDAFTEIGARFYDFLELAFRLKIGWKHWRGKSVLTDKRLNVKKLTAQGGASALLFAAVLGASAYVRLYDAYMHAAPSMSDGAVALAWTNYINQRELFHDGIYPQGLFMMMAYLQKFAAIDTLYVLKYTGGLSTWFIVVGLYFVVSRFTGGRLTALAGAAAYGLAGAALHGGDWERQGATIGQEFALLFLLPTLYFYYRYFEKGERRSLLTAAAGCAVMGLSHMIAYAYVGFGLGLLMLYVLFQGPTGRRRFLIAGIVGIASVAVTLLPIGVGLLAGHELHGSSANFLGQRNVFVPPPMNGWDIAGLVFIATNALACAFAPRGTKGPYGFAAAFSFGCFFIYMYGGTLTQNVVMQTRSESAWTLATCFAFGMACHAVAAASLPAKGRAPFWTQAAAIVALLWFLVAPTRLEPIVPYKMMWNSAAEQYLAIGKAQLPKTWVVYSQSEGYSLSDAEGYHDYISVLLNDFDPKRFPLTRWEESLPDGNISYHIYIIEEKEVYRLDPSLSVYSIMEPEYERREKEYEALREWLREYEEYNKDLVTFYEDEHIKVYYIYRGKDQEATQDLIWGKPVCSELIRELMD